MQDTKPTVLNERQEPNMSTRQRSRLVNFNRLLILALTLTGLLMDGVQRADLPFTMALLVWLWLAVFARMQAKILSRARGLFANAREPMALR
jgi:hypothetical protein